MLGLMTVTALVLVTSPLAILTAMGSRRRGLRPAVAVLAGVVFPVTWAVWYVRDEHPYRRAPTNVG